MSGNLPPPPFPPGPPGPPMYPQGGPGPSRSGNRAKILTGMAFSIVVVAVSSLVGGGLVGLLNAANASANAAATVGLLAGLAGLLVPFVLLFFDRWRMFGVGVLIGYAVWLIVAAGACVALFFAFANSYA